MPPYEIVNETPGLVRLSEVLSRSGAVALDTEFFWERTFYPVLGLVQVATCDGCWLIDAVALPDLKPLAPVLASPEVVKVLHDAPQDLGILARAAGAAPRNVFDTRLAAGFAGFGSTLSLQALLRQALGVELAKAETRSDWLRRPLSAGQLAYAAEDVIHLLPLRDTLLARCASQDVRDWLAADLSRFDAPEVYRDRDPQLAFQRVKGASRLAARPLAVLRELAAWREREARVRDWPRAHVLPDDLLVALAERAPQDRAALLAVPGFPRGMPEAVAEVLLGAVADALALPDAACPQPDPSGGLAARRALKPETDRLLAHLASACGPYGVDPALAASRADAEAYLQSRAAAGGDAHPLSVGWRGALLAGFR